ncbi:MAG TPA: hypothetical protein VE664_04160 [Actinomycetes bacterium]|jgi:hypothetical protein|nr:hypothetical protein [Actinomycetes bacterium]
MRNKSNREDIPLDNPFLRRRALAARVMTIANSLAGTVSSAAELDLTVPPPVSNAVHDLRGWAVRVENGGGARPASVDATRVIAYLRGLPDQQLLALLAELPWSRLDALLDAVEVGRPGSLTRETGG